jgi:hypothetical protein
MNPTGVFGRGSASGSLSRRSYRLYDDVGIARTELVRSLRWLATAPRQRDLTGKGPSKANRPGRDSHIYYIFVVLTHNDDPLPRRFGSHLPRRVHQVASRLAVDDPGRITWADRGIETAMLQQRAHRRSQPHPAGPQTSVPPGATSFPERDSPNLGLTPASLLPPSVRCSTSWVSGLSKPRAISAVRF